MRESLSRARLLMLALAATLALVVTASSALANSATTSANGLSVTASLSPDTVKKSDQVSQLASVQNTTRAAEHVIIAISGPLATAAPQTFVVTLAPGESFSKAINFPASLLNPGTHTLRVIALNRDTQATTSATASVDVQ